MSELKPIIILTSKQATMLDANYWDSRYKSNQTGWDIGSPSTPLKAYIDHISNKDIAILIPGCGNAYEAQYLMEKGFTNVTLIDIATSVVEKLKLDLGHYLDKGLKIIHGDFFDVTDKFDVVLEQTFFCAIHPSFRIAYVNQMNKILNNGGKIAGVLFDRSFEGGPPFGGSKKEYVELFQSTFHIKTIEACYNSIPPRMGAEVFVILQKK